MQDENICITCGHDKWSHAISLKGEIGWCMKTLIEGWSYCDCKKFTPPNTACIRRVPRRGAKVVKSKSKVRVGRIRG
jgi:hypothetical protein